MKYTELRRKDIAALTHSELVAVVWELVRDANDAATIYGHGVPHEERATLCVMTPGQVFAVVEGRVL